MSSNDLGPWFRVLYPHKQLIKRLLKGKCELCKQSDTIEVHHVRKFADLATAGTTPPAWAQVMANKRRKTLVACRACQDLIHARPAPTLTQ
ncbi:HNH endonuclease [Saccharopolyspora pogona]|uniref:HNH endonuclease n=1 Tax=Saccharopolyspora pogona TaxID=333966 RepID=UPI001CC23D2A|nr:RNA-directed DNA polymerase [Saccharopolyspora pogona]